MKKINKYTTLPVLLCYLDEKKVPLLDPEKWEDKNDVRIISSYMKRKQIKKLLATCFSFSSETIHHWNAYANEMSGCCVEFHPSLVTSIKDGDFRHEPVKYLKIHPPSKIHFEKMPFSKRYPYHIEKEYRVLYEGGEEQASLAFDLEQIQRITLSPKMPPLVFEAIKKRLKSELPKNTQVTHSTILNNEQWIEKITSC